jgi:hypothetical protein
MIVHSFLCYFIYVFLENYMLPSFSLFQFILFYFTLFWFHLLYVTWFDLVFIYAM